MVRRVAAVAALLAAAAAAPAAAAPRVTVAIVDTGAARIAPLEHAVWWGAATSLLHAGAPIDTDGHGTAMATIVHAVAPRARILPLQAFEPGGGARDRVVASAIDLAAARGARVIELSAAGAARTPRTRRAIGQAWARGALVVAAAGNDGLDASRYPVHPAGDPGSPVLAVAATDGRGLLLPDSNYGVDVAAPGLAVDACAPDGSATSVHGTSAAAAKVAGRAARRLAARPGWTAQRLRADLLTMGRRRTALASATVSGREIAAQTAPPPCAPMD